MGLIEILLLCIAILFGMPVLEMLAFLAWTSFKASRIGVATYRFGYARGWRLRYWWMDTESGKKAHLALFATGLLCTAAYAAYLTALAVIEAANPPPERVHAVADWIVYVIILIISALISYALRPKPENAKPQDFESPTTTDATPVIDYFGTNWVDHDDQFLLAWKITGRDPIKSKGGK